jgi:hypothetical protein
LLTFTSIIFTSCTQTGLSDLEKGLEKEHSFYHKPRINCKSAETGL